MSKEPEGTLCSGTDVIAMYLLALAEVLLFLSSACQAGVGSSNQYQKGLHTRLLTVMTISYIT